MVRRLASILSIAALVIGCGASPPPETTVALAASPVVASSEPEADDAPPPARPPSKPNPHRQAAEDELEETSRVLARRLFIEGAAAYDVGDYVHARRKFQEAYDLVQNQALLFNLASAELRLGNVPSACRLFRKYIAEGDPADPRIVEVQRQVAQRCRGMP